MKNNIRIRDLSSQTKIDNINDIRQFFNSYPDAIDTIIFLRRVDMNRPSVSVELNIIFNGIPELFDNQDERFQYSLREMYFKLILDNGIKNNRYFVTLPISVKTFIFDRMLMGYITMDYKKTDEIKHYSNIIYSIIDMWFNDIHALENNLDLSKIVFTESYISAISKIVNSKNARRVYIKIMRVFYISAIKGNPVLERYYVRHTLYHTYTTSYLMYILYNLYFI